MPAQPQWLLRLPQILEDFSALPAPIVDRALIERIFAVRRRRAIELLGAFGGYQVGRTFVVERDVLLEHLRGIAAGERFHFEKRRHEKLASQLARIHQDRAAARVKIPASPEPSPLPGLLPPGVRLEPGRLTIEFQQVEDLLGKLYGIAQTAARDFHSFAAAAGSGEA
jgi:hypothetical protein